LSFAGSTVLLATGRAGDQRFDLLIGRKRMIMLSRSVRRTAVNGALM